MDTNTSPLYLVSLALLPKLNNTSVLEFIEKCGGIESYFREKDTVLQALCHDWNFPIEIGERKIIIEKARQEMEHIQRHNINICSFEDNNYPFLLRQCENVPLVFFYKGHLETNEATKYLAIVGTRKASARCEAKVEHILEEIHLMGHQPLVVSGLAFGIDASAHRASLKYQMKTYAVLGHGLHMIYPASHKNLAEKILANQGALISEFPCITPVRPVNFLQRNRIIAGLSHAVLVAESAEKGGAMSTARTAFSYNREVMALPGRPEDKMSAGCNRLIKENIATLVENAKDIAKILNYSPLEAKPIQTSLNLFDTENTENTLFQLLTEKSPLHIDEIGLLTGISTNELSVILLQMELEGKITSLPGKSYTLH